MNRGARLGLAGLVIVSTGGGFGCGAAGAAPPALGPGELDRMVEEVWRAAGLAPAPPASDAELLRRTTLDVVGRVPTLDEAERFLGDREPGRRARLVDRLLGSPEHAEHWADLQMDLFVAPVLRRPRLEERLDPRAFFIAAARENRRYDALARDMLTFSGELGLGSAGVFLGSHLTAGGPEAAATATARVFLGVQIHCAQCHDHPYDRRYRQEDFYGLVAYLARTRFRRAKPGAAAAGTASGTTAPAMAMAEASESTAAAADADKRYEIFDRPNGEARFRRAGGDGNTNAEIVAPPRFLGREVAPGPGETRRQALARAVVGSELFAKAAVDRVWAQLFGRGLADPGSDLGGEGDSRHPALLGRLADDFRAGGHDMRRLLRTLLLSRAYALGGVTPGTTAGAPVAVPARAPVRRLGAEQLFRSLVVATGADHVDGEASERLGKRVERAIRDYRFALSDDEMAEIDTFAGNVPQALLLFNGPITNQGVRAKPGSTLARILGDSADPEVRLRRIFLAAYARVPTAAERGRLLPGLSAAGRAADAYEDLFFALLTSTEMLTNH